MLLPVLLASALQLSTLRGTALHTAGVADSLSGTWRVTGDVVGNPVNELCTLTQAGGKLTGSCKNTDELNAKAFDVTGEVKDGRVTFSHGGTYQGDPLTLTYRTTMASAKALQGNIDVQPFGVSGTFTAAPVAATPTSPPPTKP